MRRKVSNWQKLGKVLRSHLTPVVKKVKVEIANKLEGDVHSEPLISEECHDLAMVFRKKESDTLPPHCPQTVQLRSCLGSSYQSYFQWRP